MLEEEKILFLLLGIAPLFLCCLTHSLVTKPTELSQLLDIVYKSDTSAVKLLYIFTPCTYSEEVTENEMERVCRMNG